MKIENKVRENVTSGNCSMMIAACASHKEALKQLARNETKMCRDRTRRQTKPDNTACEVTKHQHKVDETKSKHGGPDHRKFRQCGQLPAILTRA